MGSTPTGTPRGGGRPAGDGPLPAFVDWFLGAIIALGGLLLVLGGSALVVFVDRELLAAGIEEGTVTVTVGPTELTDAEQLEVAQAIVSWTGTGLLVTGLGVILFGVGYVIVRRRVRRRAADRVDSYGMFAVLGAVATVLLSFLPVSPALGGALAGYLERRESDRTVSVGALAGVLPLLPVLVLLVFVLGGLIAGLLAIDRTGMAIVLGVGVFLVATFVGIVVAGLGALGGYVGGRIADSRAGTGRRS